MLRTSSAPLLRRLASPTTLLRYSSTSDAPPGSEKSSSAPSQHVQQSKARAQTRIEAVEPPSAQNPAFARAVEQVIIPDKFSSNSKSSNNRPRGTTTEGAGAAGEGGGGAGGKLGRLASRLLANRKKTGALYDAEASKIITAALASPGRVGSPRVAALEGVALKSRDANARPRTRSDAGAVGDRPQRAGGEGRLSPFNRSDSTTPSSPPRARFDASSPSSPRSATAQTQGRSSNGPRSAAGGSGGGGPRKPSNRKNGKGGRDSRSAGGIPSSSKERLAMPPRFAAFPKLDLASLIKKELALGSLKLVDRTPSSSSSTPPSSSATPTAQTASSARVEEQARRLALRQEQQGDYSRFYFDEAVAKEKRTAQVVNLRKILNGNTSVGLSEREFLVGKVAEAMSVGK